jgi:hypothetical protein
VIDCHTHVGEPLRALTRRSVEELIERDGLEMLEID